MEISGAGAIVTGGASGLGEATARQLAERGASVAVLDFNAERASQVAAEIGGHAVKCDVTSEEGTRDAVQEAVQKLGNLRVCVNCAGIDIAGRIVGRDGPMPLATFRRVIEVNLVGTFNVMRLAAAEMMKLAPLDAGGERGVIINTSSTAATEGQIGQSPYAASKAGISGLTLQAAREFARFGIRVVTIAPGLFRTPMWDGAPEEVYKALETIMQFPKRMGEASEFAKLAGHIVENVMLNGEVIRLDGALRMPAK
jgi:NAD(P)-dependent dehydrogenase (short-subunit alcohol dehydrogenase family)